jgi:hypothetical protein|nr:MAG TPA: hypothetical protein [Caudoviricetes sp.]
MSEIFGNGIMGGGGLTNSKLALANAQAADVRSGKKFYAGDKQIKTGALADVTQATPAITVDAAGKITASATQAAGVVAAGTKSATKQLPVQAAKTVIPSASAQTAVGEGVFTTGIVTVAAVYAVIDVTYPSGSVCTCSNGSVTLTAKDTTGKAIFVIPSAGTWTVTAVSGSKSTSKAVSITAEGQVETVELTYGLYIFKNGSGLTSGYSIKSNSMISAPTVSGNTISWSGNSSSGGVAFYIDPAVALSGYTKLCFDFECSYNYGGNYGMGFGVGTDAAASTTINNTNWTAKVTSTAQGTIARNTVQCDISALTDSEYIKIVGSYSAGKVYNIWLE